MLRIVDESGWIHLTPWTSSGEGIGLRAYFGQKDPLD